ncbi:hypothetical protein LQR30_08700 [Chromobacterium piscinae]|uniref:hypothetical protein n=1 Tax=Chromobacterium piscinae TaxID=686831 RepID=UPI001E637559|nr:hypothetical protein [Chromobacterium piscinae]MCD4504182.1 hypothetical protein [Chromobacterium piscinae]
MSTDLQVIWPPFQAFYIQSMLFNSSSAARSIARLESIFSKLPEQITEEDISRLPIRVILNELQNMVLQSAALSRYFWPVRKGHEARACRLREAFAIDEASPLFDRSLRNALEHFDERLDHYLAAGVVGYVFPEYVGAKPEDTGVPGHFFRAYFPDTGEFRLLNEEFKIQPLADELLFVHHHLTSLDQNGGMLRHANREAEGNQE